MKCHICGKKMGIDLDLEREPLWRHMQMKHCTQKHYKTLRTREWGQLPRGIK